MRRRNDITLYGQRKEPYPGWTWRWDGDELLFEKGEQSLSVHFQYQPSILQGWILVLCHKRDDKKTVFSFVVDPDDWKRIHADVLNEGG